MSQPGWVLGQSALGIDTVLTATPPNVQRIEAVREARKRIDAAFDAMLAADMQPGSSEPPDSVRAEYEAAVAAMNALTVFYRGEPT
ncbi:MAG TPA: hypothetical protein VHS78_02815 [Candidatus Elarobacter sp.]|jgi:hypothetical protein|nr:hypothetical protein [Candidatus Elarobacter sp.]